MGSCTSVRGAVRREVVRTSILLILCILFPATVAFGTDYRWANPATLLNLDGYTLAVAGPSFLNHGTIVALSGQTAALAGSFTNTASGQVQIRSGGT